MGTCRSNSLLPLVTSSVRHLSWLTSAFVPCYVHGFFKLYLKLSGSRVQNFKAIWLAELCKCLKLVVNSIAFLLLGYVQMWYNICVVLLAPCKQRLFFCYQVRWKSSCSHSYRTGTILLHFSGEQKVGVKHETCTTCLSPSCVSHASRQIHAYLHWPKKCEKLCLSCKLLLTW